MYILILNQEKDDSHPLVGTQVNSLLGQINVTHFAIAGSVTAVAAVVVQMIVVNGC